jgi:hypothetical protein
MSSIIKGKKLRKGNGGGERVGEILTGEWGAQLFFLDF